MSKTRRHRRRRCPRCGCLTGAGYCCGIDLGVHRRPWKMTKENIRLVHLIKTRKGLDEETYRLRLSAVGVRSCKELGRAAFREFLHGLSKLPDRPGWVDQSAGRGATPLRKARG